MKVRGISFQETPVNDNLKRLILLEAVVLGLIALMVYSGLGVLVILP